MDGEENGTQANQPTEEKGAQAPQVRFYANITLQSGDNDKFGYVKASGDYEKTKDTGTGFSASTFIHHAVCDFIYKGVGNTTMSQPATMGGTYAEYLASLVSFSAGYSTSSIQDVLHYDLWGCFTVTYTSTTDDPRPDLTGDGIAYA